MLGGIPLGVPRRRLSGLLTSFLLVGIDYSLASGTVTTVSGSAHFPLARTPPIS